MKQSVMNLIGAFAGLTIGSVVVPSAMLARFTGAHVSWDASQCPAGEYTVTTTARHTVSGDTYQITSSNISLPAGTVGQDFPDLPGGTYVVTARASAADGESFRSASQTLSVTGSAPAPTSPDTTLGSGGRSRPPATTATGTAQPRTGTDVSGYGGAGGRGTGESVGVELSATSAAALARLETEVSLAWALDAVAALARHGGGQGLSRLTVVDEDGDGVIDYVTFRNGAVVRIWRVSGSDR